MAEGPDQPKTRRATSDRSRSAASRSGAARRRTATGDPDGAAADGAGTTRGAAGKTDPGGTDPDGTDPGGASLRRSIELLWGMEPDRPARGPKPALSIEAIVAAAAALADREGLAALSMARIAKELGFTTMSLYRYVRSKDELLVLITDATMGRAPDMAGISDWRDGLTRWAEASRTSFLRHPWCLQVPITGPPVAPNSVGWLDAGLQALADTRLSEQEKASVVLLVSGFVRNEVGMQRDLATHDDQQLEPGAPRGGTYGDLLRLVVREEDFPALHRAVEAAAFDDDLEYGDEEFAFGLETVLDGVAALVERRRARSRRRSR